MLHCKLLKSNPSPIHALRLSPFLLYPIVQIAKSSKSLKVVEKTVEIILLIINLISSDLSASDETVLQILAILPIIGYENRDIYQSEELKLHICSILNLIIPQASISDQAIAPILAHNITMLLYFLDKKHFYKLSVETILVIKNIVENVKAGR
jgi:hypothetical protein